MSANVLKFPEPEPDFIKAIKHRLALLNEVQIELDKETAQYLRMLKSYEEQR